MREPRKTYRVEHKGKPPLGWFQSGPRYETKNYCLGYLHGITSYYPCPELRVVCDQTGEVVQAGGPNNAVHVNSELQDTNKAGMTCGECGAFYEGYSLPRQNLERMRQKKEKGE